MEVPPHARAVPFLRGHRFAADPPCSADYSEDCGTTKLTTIAIFVALVVGVLAGCTGRPGGGVTGIVFDSSGTPVEGVEIVVVDAPEILGVVVPWEEPLRLAAKTDESGRFRFLWSHGNPKSGPLLEVHAVGYAQSSTRLDAGYSECEVRLKTQGQAEAAPEARCSIRTVAETGG